MKQKPVMNLSRSAGAAFVVVFSCSTVHAADRDWDSGGGIDTDFSNAANWTSDTAPVAGDNALINGTATITSNQTVNLVETGRWWGTGTVTQTAGLLTTNGFNVGFIGTGTYNLTGTGSISVANDFLLGHSGGGTDAGAGTFNMNTSGSFTINYVNIANSSWGSYMTSGTFNQSAGTTTSTYGFTVGGNATKGGASYKGIMNLSGGTVHSNGNFRIGDGWEGAKGEFTMTGGTLNVTGSNGTEFWVGSGHAGDYSTVGTGTAHISSGTLNVGSWLVVGREGGAGTLTISGDGVVNQGTTDAGANLELGNFGQNNTSVLNLDGGTLAVNGIYDNGGAGNSTTFNFNGGTLKARKDNGDFLNADTINVRNGGAVIDSNGFNIAIDNVFAASGTGGLTKNGSGTLTTNADHTFTGLVAVNAGTLSVTNGSDQFNNAFSTVSGITVNSGATLHATSNALFGWDGSQVKTITINGGTAIAAGGDQIVGNVILNGGTLASVSPDGYWGSWGLGRNAAKTLSVTDNATVSAGHVSLINGADIHVSSGKTLNFTGTVGDGGWAASSVIKNGDGTLTLAGSNFYTGTTVVNAGTLAINGDQSAATGNISVSNAASRLIGTGTVGGDATISSGAIHSAGGAIANVDKVGKQTFDKAAANTTSLTYGSGSIFEWDLNANKDTDGLDPEVSADNGNRGTDYDAVDVTGTLTVESGAIFRVVLGSGVFADSFWQQTQTWTDIFQGGFSLTGGFDNSLLQVVDTNGANYAQSALNPGYGFSVSGTTLT